MQISILLALYNSEPFIKRCLRSVVSQTFTDYEVVLVDDASTDSGLQIAEQFLKKHQVTFQSIKHQQNEYLATTRNTGINAAKGKYIMFMDQDDELAHNGVLAQFHEAIKEEKVDFVTANSNTIFGKTDVRKITMVAEKTRLQDTAILQAFLYGQISMSAWNKLIDKEFLLHNHLFFKKDLICEDELWAFQVCMAAKKCYCLPSYNYSYHKDNPNAITRNKNEALYASNIAILKEQLAIAKQKQQINKQSTDAFISHFRRMSKKVLLPRVLNNKPQWINYYRQISQIYRHSELYQYKKLFRLPAVIAYFVCKESRKNMVNNGNKFYRKLLAFAHRYNGI